MKPNGVILYRGPSMLDGAPIVAIATGLADATGNRKTGAMVQTWIMREDVAPTDALKSGADASVCGDCPHRPINGGACYVTVFQAPLSVWKAYKRGVYPYAARNASGPMLADIGADRVVRLGSYGDPAAVPFEVWEAFTSRAVGHSGYTHQWRTADRRIGSLCMASADSPSDRDEAKAMGYRTFRIRLASEPVQSREVVCPASEEGGHKLTCAECRACSGTESGRKGDVVIVAHGAASKVNAYARSRA